MDDSAKPHEREWQAMRAAADELAAQGRWQQALAAYDAMLAHAPGDLQGRTHRGNVLRQLGRLDEAILAYRHVLADDPSYRLAWANLGSALHAAGDLPGALAGIDRAIALGAGDAGTRCNRGVVLQALGRHEEAIAEFNLVIDARPKHADALYNRANSYQATGRYVQARDDFLAAHTLRPGHVDTLYNLGTLLQSMNRHRDAVVCFERALAARPGDLKTRFNLSLSLLSLGDLARGFAEYETRWQLPPLEGGLSRFPMPRLASVGDAAGRRVLVHAEQGLGDTIQFARYASRLAASGSHVLLSVPRQVERLLRDLDGVASVLAGDNGIPPADFHCPLLSLPGLMQATVNDIPMREAYLHVPSAEVDAWHARLGATRRLRVGLAWSGNPGHVNDRARSIPLAALEPLRDAGCEFISLQKEYRASDRPALQAWGDLRDLSADLRDMRDTAALISALDLVICVDTSVAHLAGALGKPAWIALAHAADWRWLTVRRDSPWYASVRLYRQPQRDAWPAVVEEIRRDLVSLAATGATGTHGRDA